MKEVHQSGKMRRRAPGQGPLYGWKGDNDRRQWMEYEYQTVWSPGEADDARPRQAPDEPDRVHGAAGNGGPRVRGDVAAQGQPDGDLGPAEGERVVARRERRDSGPVDDQGTA